MEELNKKVIGNAFSAYFMVFVCSWFLISKDPNVNHPFVRSHVKVALMLHTLLILIFFIMSYTFLDSIRILDYSLNTILTAFLLFCVFWGILYGMYKAKNAETLTLGDMFQKARVSKNIIKYESTGELGEEERMLLSLAHIPLLGYIIHPRHKKIPHIENIVKLNLFTMIIACLFFAFGYKSLASIIFLSYIIWSVFQSIRLNMEHTLSDIDLSFFPSIEQKYILQKALLTLIKNALSHKKHISFQKIVQVKKEEQYTRELEKVEQLKKLPLSKIPAPLFYIPFINIIWIFFLKTREQVHIKNGLLLTLISGGLIFFFHWDTPLIIFICFPLFYGIGYIQRKAYPMPYIYDIHRFLSYILSKVTHIFHKTRNLQKTDKQETLKMNEIKKES